MVVVSHIKKASLVICTLGFLVTDSSYGAVVTKRESAEQNWGIGIGVRSATIVFDTDDESVSSFVPLLFYKGNRFFLDGTEGGVKLFGHRRYRVDLLGSLRFFDIPRDFQNKIQGDTVDFGVRMQYSLTDDLEYSVDVLTDEGGRVHGTIALKYALTDSRLELQPAIKLKMGTENFNSYYYGLGQVDVDDGFDLSLGISARYHLWRHLYAIGRIQSTWFGSDVRESPFVDRDSSQEIYLGVGVFNEDRTNRKPVLSIDPYLRVAHGWATPSNIGDIITGNTESDEYDNKLTSLFYGHPLTDEMFRLPLAIYLTPGFIYHWDSDVQSSIPEFVVAIKAYYTFNWPITWRFGFAEGISYVTDIPYVEGSEMDRKGYEPSNLMNYLDFSLDVNLGTLFGNEALNRWFLGYSIHHRSAIFESASQFGRISGGANFNTIYLQYHF